MIAQGAEGTALAIALQPEQQRVADAQPKTRRRGGDPETCRRLPAPPLRSAQQAGRRHHRLLSHHIFAVVGSIIVLTSVILLAGKPLIAAWRRITASSFAM